MRALRLITPKDSRLNIYAIAATLAESAKNFVYMICEISKNIYYRFNLTTYLYDASDAVRPEVLPYNTFAHTFVWVADSERN